MSLKLCVYSKDISRLVSPISPTAAILDFGLQKIPPEFSGGVGGQISFKLSQEPKTSEKKYWTEVGHGFQELDLTNIFSNTE